jgi:hypothetical protein
MQTSIEINLRPKGHEIDEAGKTGSAFLKSQGFSDAEIHAQISILRELIHNGIRYGKFTPSKDKITALIHITENTITFEVKNPVDESCFERLRELDKTIQFIRGYQDPFEAYLLKQKEASQKAICSEANGLGLARIACEGRTILDFFVGEDNILNFCAVRNLDDDFRN